jgi:EAL domain-containing protein (putative c-di-GMP-specific phosphodiesterase class I)/FixJ family two-component response regulator
MHSRVAQKKHVLLVDDEKNLAQMLCMLLETRGYEVQLAHSASEAFEKISSKFDLVVLDLVLPDEDGFAVCRRLKQQSQTQHIPIILLSAHALFEDRLQGLYLGADDFLTKPCEHEELIARMEVVMRRRTRYNQMPDLSREQETIYELRRTLDEGLITPFYQPIYLLDPFQLYGLEVLSRPITGGLLESPDVLFKAALTYGMYTDLEILSWSKALGPAAQCLTKEKIFLNCNPYFIESLQFMRVQSIFDKHRILPRNVTLEITERSAITDFDLFYQRLHHYRNEGFRFAVDDVGGGYASLESIVETKPEVVKIDRHIVKNLDKDSFKRSIVKFVVALCQEHGMISVAEGIETQKELDIVRELGVTAGQGYFLYPPISRIDLPLFQQIIL